MKVRTRAAVVIATTIAALELTTLPGQAKSSPAVLVPQHPAVAGLRLLGASTGGVVVGQSGADAGSVGDKIYSGAEGTQLTERSVLEPSRSEYTNPTVVAVDGTTLAWQQEIPGAGIHYWQVHRMDLRTGKDVDDGEMPRANGYTRAGWLSTTIANFATFPLPPAQLKRYRPDPDGTFLTGTPLVAVDQYSGSAVGNDESSMLFASYVNTDLSQNDGAPRYSLDLLDLTEKTSTRLVDTIAEVITAVALSPHTVAWVTRVDDGDGVTHHYTGPALVHLRPRAGGPVVTYTESADPDGTAQITATDEGVGYVVSGSGNTQLRVVATDGTGARSVDLPDGSSGVFAVGSRFLTAAGGTDSVAGVYSVSGSTLTRTATVPTATYPIDALSLSNSILHYADASVGGHSGDTLWQRNISGRNRPRFGAEAVTTTTPAVDGDVSVPADSGEISFSAGRGAIRTTHDGSWHLLDRGHETGTIPGAGGIQVSGAYVLSGGKVYRPDGELVWSEPALDDSSSGSDHIFGSTLIYSRQPQNGTGQIWVVPDVEHPDPEQIAEVYPATDYCFEAPQVAVWGESVAWGSACTADGVILRNLRTKEYRDVQAASGVGSFALGEGTLAWPTAAGTDVLDLPAPNDTAPITLPGRSTKLLLDDHRIARQLWARGRVTGYDVQTLPFDQKYPPRLIAPYANGGFTPDGDGHADTWTPQFDVTKPLKSTELSLTDSTGKVVRKLVGTAPDGSIRDLSWDGRNGKGAQLPVGTYQWQLTGRADDGDGTLVGPWGRATVHGTLEINAI
jgi:flagellar hook capping protein FlgD